MSNQYKEKTSQILIRVKPNDKDRIKSLAKKCGLSTTEYVTQRALGYEPRVVPPDALFHLLEKVGSLENKSTSAELNAEISAVLKEITAAFLLPGKG